MASSVLRTVRTVLWTLVVVAAGGAAWLYYNQTQTRPAEHIVFSEGFGSGDYQLVDHTGAPFVYEDFLGKPAMVFFGFTHCPDVCPTTLADMTYWYEQLGPDADKIEAFFVSVDPERDTPELMASYVEWTNRVTGVTGTRAEIDKIIEAWGVYAARSDLENGGYNVDHTASVFLIDAQGQFFGTIAYEEASDPAIGKLRRLASAI